MSPPPREPASRRRSTSAKRRSTLYPIAFLLLYTRGVLTAFRKREGKTRRERYQVFLAIAVLCLLTFYLLTLVVAAVEIIAPDLLGWLPSEVPQGIVVALTALGLWKSDLVADLVAGAVGFICVMAYLGHGERREPLIGQLVALIDWAYFEQSRPEQVPEKWFNVYSPIDVLASNFRRDGGAGEPDTGIPTTAADAAGSRRPVNVPYGEPTSAADMSPLQFITFMGLRSHSIYWGRVPEAELTAFSPIVTRIYANQPVLS